MNLHVVRCEQVQQAQQVAQADKEPQVKPFPLEVLPSPLRRFVEEGAEAICCPPDFLAVPLLVLAGVAIGTSRLLRVKEGWEEGPQLFAAIVADPGAKKSPALKLCLTPFFEKQQQYLQEYTAAKKLYEAKILDFEIQYAQWQKSLKTGQVDPGNRPTPPQEPLMPQLYTTDCTIEALASVLAHNPRGVLLFQDELTAWVRSMDQYRSIKGADRQHWLSLWAAAPLVVNRKTQKEPIILPHPFVGVVGGIPPDVLPELLDPKNREDGFVHRILFSFPDRLPSQWTEAQLSSNTLAEIRKLFEGLWRLSCSVTSGVPQPHRVSFTAAGKVIWVAWIKEHYAEYESPDFPEYLVGTWAKMEAHAARLALILQECRFVCGEADDENIDEFSMAGAADLIDYFKTHARRVYNYFRSTSQDKSVNTAIRWIKARGGRVTARDIVRFNVAGVKKTSDALSLFRELQDRAYGSIIREGKTIYFELSPDTPDS